MEKRFKRPVKSMIIGLAFFIVLVSLSGCVDEKSKFVGTWQTQDGATTITFNDNNIATIAGSGPLGIVSLVGTFNYSIANQQVTFSSGGVGVTLNYSFPSSTQLILTNNAGASVILNKT